MNFPNAFLKGASTRIIFWHLRTTIVIYFINCTEESTHQPDLIIMTVHKNEIMQNTVGNTQTTRILLKRKVLHHYSDGKVSLCPAIPHFIFCELGHIPMVTANTVYINNTSILSELLRKSLPYKTSFLGEWGDNIRDTT
jgi:hypothetical protein